MPIILDIFHPMIWQAHGLFCCGEDYECSQNHWRKRSPHECSGTFFLSLLYKWFPVSPRSIYQVLRGLQSRSKSKILIWLSSLMFKKYVVTWFIYTKFYLEVILWKACKVTRNEIFKSYLSTPQIIFTGCFTQCKLVVLRWSDEHSIEVKV